jgi:hypothetical protein
MLRDSRKKCVRGELGPANAHRKLIPRKLLHVTNQLYKQGILVQIRWIHCNKANNFQYCQHCTLRVLPDGGPKRFCFNHQRQCTKLLTLVIHPLFTIFSVALGFGLQGHLERIIER